MEVKEVVTTVESFVNDTSFKPLKVAAGLSKIHRYLQSELFKMCYHYIIILAHYHNTGQVDSRNESACETAAKMLRGLQVNKDDLYNLYKDQYEEQD